ncbi:uroporphyrinogen-III C-methyltransferase [Frigoribacterium sp. RIT-PI-h]|uniref:uroporphyrinogen-III C-methyltransferase n=1 Tax=Frigoribacterium sp. RIT-PI-h TaxID=1690245 RepID=UPI0009EB2E10|nr:uroporphyrinogen-III C-methyltransferase [Frigoribacterium sp. RIT-PI-h]
MQLTLDLIGRHVLVVGRPDRARHAVAAVRADGAVVESRPADDAARHLGEMLAGAGPRLLHLVVWVEGPEEARLAITASAAALEVPLATAPATDPSPPGHGTLVGGGPGAPGRLARAGRAALAAADVVRHDRLGPGDRVAELAPGAELVDVGKTPGHHAVPQHEIEALLVDHAVRGRRVVRLKGGDAFVFGRGGEEVAACRRAGVPVTVVPGVTSAIAVPEEAGIPVTHREVSRAFTVLSGHVPFSDDELRHLVGLGGTIVVLMGVANLPQTAAGLRRHGLGVETPMAVLESGFTDRSRRTVTTLGEVDALVGTFRSPAVIVIGEVVRVADAGLDEVADLVAFAAPRPVGAEGSRVASTVGSRAASRAASTADARVTA